MKAAFFILFALFLSDLIGAQPQDPEWDKITAGKWGTPFRLVQIPSTADQSVQQAWQYTSTAIRPQPLVVSLHTWSGDFMQEDPLAAETLLRNWNYIHPDFRGANTKPEACGSRLVLADLKDAIRYMINTGRVDTTAIHLIGVSGGGYATLMAYLQLDIPVRSFNAWVPLSDLGSWYNESIARGLKYAKDLEQVATVNGQFKVKELDYRSPLQLNCNYDLLKHRELHLYTGIHDGYTGSVPVSHSLLFYNKIAACLQPGKPEYRIPDSVIIALLARRVTPVRPGDQTIFGRKIHYQQQLPGLSVTVFEGGHEMLAPVALSLLPGQFYGKQLQVVTIGDSNGALPFGWPAQLRKLLPAATVHNFSMAGNTIGFDNLGQEKLNTIRNIDQFLTAAGGTVPDIIFIGLGTNDTKDIFSTRQEEVISNMEELVKKINRFYANQAHQSPAICILAAPPVNEQTADTAKYKGCADRIVRNNSKFENLSQQLPVFFIDPYNPIRSGINAFTTDGVHLNPSGQFVCASALAAFIQLRL